MAVIVELILLFALCILALGAWGILAAVGICVLYYGLLRLFCRMDRIKKPPG